MKLIKESGMLQNVQEKSKAARLKHVLHVRVLRVDSAFKQKLFLFHGERKRSPAIHTAVGHSFRSASSASPADPEPNRKGLY